MSTNINLFFDGYINYIIKEFDLEKQSTINKGLIPKDKAFEIFSISTVLGKSFSEGYHEINTGGYENEKFSSADGGFDGIYLEETGNDSYVIHIFQCKNKSTLSPKELNDFYYDIDIVFKRGEDNGKPLNKKTKKIIDTFKSLKGKYIEYKLYFIYNGENSFGNNQKLIDEYKDKFLILDKNKIYKEIGANISEGKRKDLNFIFDIQRSNINFGDDLQSIISFGLIGVQSYVFKISALEICRMIEEEEKQNSTIENLYSKNIRGFLGYRAKPNKKMRETIQDSKQGGKFYLYNNGLTIICDSLKEPNLHNGNYTFSIKNPIIVNGLQTSQVIYKEYQENPNNLKNVFLLIRLYQTTDNEIIEKITETTNNQSAINYGDQLSNKDFNTFAQEIFTTIGVNYITKRGDIFKQENIKSHYTDINNDTLLKFWFATFLQKPTIAKNSIRKVTGDILNNINNDTIDSNKSIKQFFEGGKDAKILTYLLETYYIYHCVIHKKNSVPTDKKLSDFILNSDELMAYGIYKELQKGNKSIDEKNILKIYNVVYENIFTIVQEEFQAKEQAHLTYSHNNYFKGMKCKIDYDKISGFIDLEDEEIIDTLT